MVRLERSRNQEIKDDLEILLKVTFMLVREVKLFWLPFSPVRLFIWNQSQAVSQRVLGFPPVQPGEQTHVLCLLGFNPFRCFLNFLLSKCSIFGRLLDKYFYRQCCRQSMKVFPTIKCLLWTSQSSLPASNEYLAASPTKGPKTKCFIRLVWSFYWQKPPSSMYNTSRMGGKGWRTDSFFAADALVRCAGHVLGHKLFTFRCEAAHLVMIQSGPALNNIA